MREKRQKISHTTEINSCLVMDEEAYQRLNEVYERYFSEAITDNISHIILSFKIDSSIIAWQLLLNSSIDQVTFVINHALSEEEQTITRETLEKAYSEMGQEDAPLQLVTGSKELNVDKNNILEITKENFSLDLFERVQMHLNTRYAEHFSKIITQNTSKIILSCDNLEYFEMSSLAFALIPTIKSTKQSKVNIVIAHNLSESTKKTFEELLADYNAVYDEENSNDEELTTINIVVKMPTLRDLCVRCIKGNFHLFNESIKELPVTLQEEFSNNLPTNSQSS